ncbi:MAG: GtrA family protein [Paludibacter sp.]|nr:GtrA family protein [Paludibacter sp.]
MSRTSGKKARLSNWLREKAFTFSKAQLSAFVGGMIDYGIMIFLTEFFHLHYTVSILISGVTGAVINFSLNKKWTFHSKNQPYKHGLKVQLIKFILVVINSIFMKSYGTFLITQFIGIDYKISRLFVDAVVSLVFNFNLQKYWVFKKA